jgi:hypothetical protein
VKQTRKLVRLLKEKNLKHQTYESPFYLTAMFIIFVDDTTTLIPCCNVGDIDTHIQFVCYKIFDWFTNNRLKLNVFKTKCMFFALKTVYCQNYNWM